MWRDRGNSRDHDLPQIALDVEFPRITHATEGENGGLAGMESGLRGEILGGIGLGGAIQVAVVEGRRLHHHEVGRFQIHPALRNAASPMPTPSAAMRMRSGFMPCRIERKPSPSAPMRSASGIAIASKNISFESTAWRPILSITRTATRVRSRSV